MILIMSQSQADRMELDRSAVHPISPYLNPAHVLAPPREWLEALVEGRFDWSFFRLRYKNLLWKRYRDDPARFFHLLRDSEGPRRLYLTCHCLTSVCHRDVARDFLQQLRQSDPYLVWGQARTLPFFGEDIQRPAKSA